MEKKAKRQPKVSAQHFFRRLVPHQFRWWSQRRGLVLAHSVASSSALALFPIPGSSGSVWEGFLARPPAPVLAKVLLLLWQWRRERHQSRMTSCPATAPRGWRRGAGFVRSGREVFFFGSLERLVYLNFVCCTCHMTKGGRVAGMVVVSARTMGSWVRIFLDPYLLFHTKIHSWSISHKNSFDQFLNFGNPKANKYGSKKR